MGGLPGVEESLDASTPLVFDAVVRRGGEAMGGPVAILLLDHLDLVDSYLTAVYPECPATAGRLPLRVEDGPLARVLRGQEAVYAPYGEWQIRPLRERYLYAAPIRLRDTAIGVILSGGDDPPTESELADLRRLGVEAGISISVADGYTDLVELSRRRATPSIAAEMQSDHLPPRSLYTPEVRVVGGIEPVYDVGGDWFDYSLDAGRLFVAVCDGVGRGLEAASISYVSLGAVRNARKRGCGLEETMKIAHQALVSATNYEQFATLILASIDLRTLRMELVSAAHPAPVLLPPPGSGPPGAMQLSHESHPPLGAFDGEPEYAARSYELPPGSRLLFFSDGAVERRDGKGRFLGVERLLEYATQARQRGRVDLLSFLMHKVQTFGESEIEDDVTIVGVDLPPFG